MKSTTRGFQPDLSRWDLSKSPGPCQIARKRHKRFNAGGTWNHIHQALVADAEAMDQEAMHSLRKGQGTMFAYDQPNPDAVIVRRVFENA